MKEKDEVIKDMEAFREFFKIKKKGTKYPYKKEINRMLREIPLEKIKKAKKVWKDGCKWIMHKMRNEQIYRSLYGSMKIRSSYYAFISGALIILYLYGHIPDKEFSIDKISPELLDKYKDAIPKIRDVFNRLKDEKYFGAIPMEVMMMTFGAGQVFCFAAKSIIQIVERMHKDKEYRERHYYGAFLDWDEAILFKALCYELYKKNPTGIYKGITERSEE